MSENDTKMLAQWILKMKAKESTLRDVNVLDLIRMKYIFIFIFYCLFTIRSCQRGVFSWEGRIFLGIKFFFSQNIPTSHSGGVH